MVNHLGNNIVLNAGQSTQDTFSALRKITPLWSITQHKDRSAALVSFTSIIWKKIHPSRDVSAIQGPSNKFKKLWDVFDEEEYNSKTSIVKIMEFIKCLVKKKGEWTQS